MEALTTATAFGIQETTKGEEVPRALPRRPVCGEIGEGVYTRWVTMRPPTLAASMLAALLTLTAACAGARGQWGRTGEAQVLLEVLPRSAAIDLDGQPVGSGSHSVPVPDPAHQYRFRVSAPGFDPIEVTREGRTLAGTRVGIALRPEGFGTARTLDIDQPDGLARAASALLRAGRDEDAVDYASRAIELASDVPLPHRVLGAAYAKLGRRKESIAEYTAYLTLAPNAPDAAAVQTAISQARGDITIPLPPAK